MTERQGVEIDYCPTCRGVWLDRGELDKIIERADGGSSRKDDYDRDEHRHEGREHTGHPHRKKESFWERMFDFD